MKIAWLSGLSDQNLVTNPQCYKERQKRSSFLSTISMYAVHITVAARDDFNRKVQGASPKSQQD